MFNKIFRTISRIKCFNTEKYPLYSDKKLQIAPYRGSDKLSKRTELIKKSRRKNKYALTNHNSNEKASGVSES